MTKWTSKIILICILIFSCNRNDDFKFYNSLNPYTLDGRDYKNGTKLIGINKISEDTIIIKIKSKYNDSEIIENYFFYDSIWQCHNHFDCKSKNKSLNLDCPDVSIYKFIKTDTIIQYRIESYGDEVGKSIEVLIKTRLVDYVFWGLETITVSKYIHIGELAKAFPSYLVVEKKIIKDTLYKNVTVLKENGGNENRILHFKYKLNYDEYMTLDDLRAYPF